MKTQSEPHQTPKLPFFKLYKDSVRELVSDFKTSLVYASIALIFIPLAYFWIGALKELFEPEFYGLVESNPQLYAPLIIAAVLFVGFSMSYLFAPIYRLYFTKKFGSKKENLHLSIKIFIISLISAALFSSIYWIFLELSKLIFNHLPLASSYEFASYVIPGIIVMGISSNFSPVLNFLPSAAAGKKMTLKDAFNLGRSNRLRLLAAFFICTLMINMLIIGLISIPAFFLINVIEAAFSNAQYLNHEYLNQYVTYCLSSVSILIMVVYYSNIYKFLTNAQAQTE